MTEVREPFNWQRWIRDFQKKPGGMYILFGLAGLGIALLMSGGRPESTGMKAPVAEREALQRDESEIMTVEKRMERELSRTLERMDGVGKVTVKIHLKTGHRRIWERQSRITKRAQQQQQELHTEESSSDEIVLAGARDGVDNPILKEELAPEIEGVVVVATGASNPRVKQLLTDTVMTILNLPSHRVLVIAGKEW